MIFKTIADYYGLILLPEEALKSEVSASCFDSKCEGKRLAIEDPDRASVGFKYLLKRDRIALLAFEDGWYPDGWNVLTTGKCVKTQDSCHDIARKILSKDETWDPSSGMANEYGYICNSLHSNYTSSHRTEDLSTLSDVADSLSRIDVTDAQLYEGHWFLFDYLSYETLNSVISTISNTIDSNAILPGSSWTRFNQMKGRMSRLQRILACVHIECFPLLLTKLETLRDLHVTDNELDCMNLVCGKPLKQPEVKRIKEALKTKPKASPEGGESILHCPHQSCK